MKPNPESTSCEHCQNQVVSEQSQPSNGTELLQLEAALRQTQAEMEEYRTLYESLPAIYFTLDLAGVVVRVNQFGAARLGYTTQELIAHPVFHVFHPEEHARLQAEFDNFLQDATRSVTGEFRLVGKDGRMIWVKVSGCAAPGTTANQVILLLCEEIAERKQIEEELNQQLHHLEELVEKCTAQLVKTNEQLQKEIAKRKRAEAAQVRLVAILEATTDFVGIADINGHAIYVNKAGRKLVGVEEEEGILRDIPDFHPKWASDIVIQEALPTALQDGVWSGETALLHRDGREIPVSQVVMAHKSENGTIEFFSTIARDISDRKRTEETLRRSEELYRTLAQNFPNGAVVLFDRDCRYIFADGQELERVGLSKAALEGKTIWEIYPPEFCAILEPRYRAALAGSEAIFEAEFGGRTYLINTQPIKNERGEVWAGISTSQNISDRKQAEEALRQQFLREQVVAATLGRIHQSLNLEEILQTTVTEVRQFLACDRVIIYRCNPDGSGVVVVESVGSDWIPMSGTIVHDCYFAQTYAQVYQQGRVQAVDDIYTAGLTQCYIDLLAQFQVRANLVVPILQAEQLWGLLIAHHCSGSRQWQHFEIDLLKQLATQVGIAIQQSQLYKQTQHQVQREQALNRVIQSIRNSLDLTTIFSTAAFEIAQLLQADGAHIVQYLPQRKLWLNVEDYRRSPDLPSAQGLEIPDEGNLIAARLKRLEVVRIDDASTCEDEINQSFAQTFPGGWLLVPLHFGSTLWGSLSLERNRQPSSWQNSEVELACVVADQLAIAIQQSELFRQVQQLNTVLEEQVQERTAQLLQALNFEAMLKRITDKVRDSLDESHILQAAVQELALGLEVDCCDTALYDPSRGTLTICYDYTTSSILSARGTEILMADLPDICPRLLQGQYLHFCEIRPDPIRPMHRETTILACPIFDDQGVLGDLWLFDQNGRVFNQLEIRLVQQVANQCAIAIRQARLYQASLKQVEELERLNRLKDDFLNTVSHELRTPMANIKMAIQMLEIVLDWQGNFGRETVTKAELSKAACYFQILNDECARESSLINDLLDLQRLDAGNQPIDATIIYLQDWIPHVVEPFEGRALNQQQILQVDVAAELPPLVSDTFSLGRILAELLNNACKYTPAQETITVTARASSGMILLSVSNSGVEIPEAELSHVFDKFYRIPSNDPWKQGGTGLGLALVKKLTKHLGGRIWVESAAGQTCFTVELPLSLEARC